MVALKKAAVANTPAQNDNLPPMLRLGAYKTELESVAKIIALKGGEVHSYFVDDNNDVVVRFSEPDYPDGTVDFEWKLGAYKPIAG